MGLLDDTPSDVLVDPGGEGKKFVRLYLEVFDDEDRTRFRRWIEDDKVGTTEAWRRLQRVEKYRMARSTLERGVLALRAAQWGS